MTNSGTAGTTEQSATATRRGGFFIPHPSSLIPLLALLVGCSSSHSAQFIIDPPAASQDVRDEIRSADAGRLRFMVSLYAGALDMRDYTLSSREPETVAYWAESARSSAAYMGARHRGERLVLDVGRPSRGIAVWPFAKRRVSWNGLIESLRTNLGAAYHGRVYEPAQDARVPMNGAATAPKSPDAPPAAVSG